MLLHGSVYHYRGTRISLALRVERHPLDRKGRTESAQGNFYVAIAILVPHIGQMHLAFHNILHLASCLGPPSVKFSKTMRKKNPLNVRSSEEMTRFHFLEISQILGELSLQLEWIHVVAYVLRCFAKEFSAKFILWLHEEFAFKIACNVCKMMPMKLWFCKCWAAVMQFWGQRLSAVEQKHIFRIILT